MLNGFYKQKPLNLLLQLDATMDRGRRLNKSVIVGATLKFSFRGKLEILLMVDVSTFDPYATPITSTPNDRNCSTEA
jgi:hypothetical protein